MHLITALRSWPLRRDLHGDLLDFVTTSPRPHTSRPTSVDGPDPLRVLLLGSGLAVGYGVSSRHSALDGHLARRLAAMTGRGVEVSNFASPSRPLLEQVLEAQLTQPIDSYDVVVWTPSSLDICTRPLPPAWSARFTRLLDMTGRRRPLIVPTLPVAQDGGERATPAVRLAVDLNRDLRRAAHHLPAVQVVDCPPLSLRSYGHPVITSAFFAELADVIADAALDAVAPEVLAN